MLELYIYLCNPVFIRSSKAWTMRYTLQGIQIRKYISSLYRTRKYETVSIIFTWHRIRQYPDYQTIKPKDGIQAYNECPFREQRLLRFDHLRVWGSRLNYHTTKPCNIVSYYHDTIQWLAQSRPQVNDIITFLIVCFRLHWGLVTNFFCVMRTLGDITTRGRGELCFFRTMLHPRMKPLRFYINWNEFKIWWW